jgi:DNA-binding HxlR family transcriptional regulator
MIALTPKQKKLLEWLQRVDNKMLLESQVTSSGLSRELNDLLVLGLVDMDAHPTVVERRTMSVPAAAVTLTNKGRAFQCS